MRRKHTRLILLVALIIAIAGIILYLESQKVTPGETLETESDIVVEDIVRGEEGEEELSESSEDNGPSSATEMRLAMKHEQYDVAKEISTPDGFINVESINITDLIGEKIILVDFWTYSCINCQRTLPYLNSWHEKYALDGLVIIGLHTPEFEFEKDYDNVVRATEKWGVTYPVVLDNDYSTWRSYQNRYWPRKYLIDIDGFIVYDHIGEGAYEETEAKIVELLNEKNEILGKAETVEMDDSKPEDIDAVDFTKVGSPETYLGSKRIARSDGTLSIVNSFPSMCVAAPCDYTMVDTSIPNRFSLSGRWNIGPEAAVLESETGSIYYRFHASKVNLVAESELGVEAEIYLDGKLIMDTDAGSSVMDGAVLFKESDLYNLVDLNGRYETHLIEIRFLEPGVGAFAFTFG